MERLPVPLVLEPSSWSHEDSLERTSRSNTSTPTEVDDWKTSRCLQFFVHPVQLILAALINLVFKLTHPFIYTPSTSTDYCNKTSLQNKTFFHVSMSGLWILMHFRRLIKSHWLPQLTSVGKRRGSLSSFALAMSPINARFAVDKQGDAFFNQEKTSLKTKMTFKNPPFQ